MTSQSELNESTTESTQVVRYSVAESQIAELAKKFAGVTFDTPSNYETGRKAIAQLRELRLAVETERKTLNADALSWQRKVNSVAKRYVALVEDIENPLQLAKDTVDEEKARLRREKEEAEQARIEAEARAKLEAEEKAAREKREAQQAELDRQRAELEAERAALAKEREAAEAREHAAREAREALERAEKAKRDEEARVEHERVAAAQQAESDRLAAIAAEQAAERDRLAAESRRLKAEQEFTARQEFERTTKLRLEAEQKAQAERDRIAAEQARVAEAERVAAAEARLEALRPDAARLHAFAAELRALKRPVVKAAEAQVVLEQVESVIEDVVFGLEAFGDQRKEPAASAAE